MTEFVAPITVVTVGDWEMAEPASVRVRSSRRSPFDLATVELDNTGRTVPSLAKGAPVEVWQGYRESGLVQVFGGLLDDVQPGLRTRLEARDHLAKLDTIEVCRAWLDTPPQSIVEQLLALAGVPAQVELRDLPTRHRFVAPRQSVLSAVRSVLRAWDVPGWDLWASPEGEVYCGPWEQSPRWAAVPEIALERGEEITDLKVRDLRDGWCELVSLPDLRHSQVVLLDDAEFLQEPVTVRLETVIHSWPPARTELEWRRLS